MSSLAIRPAITDVTSKWELAQRISGHARAPEQAVKSIFEEIMQQLEVQAQTKFEAPMKEKIWQATSSQRLRISKESFVLEFCDQILDSFSEEEAAAALTEHKTTGFVKNILYKSRIQKAYALCCDSIIDSVVMKAKSMADGWLPEIVAAVTREGIKLPESKRAATTSSLSVVIENTIPAKPKKARFEEFTNAVETGNLDQVRESLRNGANPNGSVGVQNIIHLACEKGNIDIVRELLDNGAELNSRSSKWDDTPLHRACVCGHTEVVAELIKRGAMVHIRNSNGWQTPLENAITFKHFECCKLLVQARAKVNEVNHNVGSTPLREACREGSYEIVELLLNSGADPSLSSPSGITPLYEAVHSPAILQLMLDRGAKANVRNGPHAHYPYPIHSAASWGYEDSVRILLKAGADPKVEDDRGITPVALARWQLNFHRTSPCNPPDVTAKMIQRLEKVIGLLEG